MPALAKHASTRPNCASVSANAASTALRSLTSQILVSNRPPWARSCVAAFAFFSAFRPQIDTAQPAAASASAMPRPIPPLPPVTTATRPDRSKLPTPLALQSFPISVRARPAAEAQFRDPKGWRSSPEPAGNGIWNGSAIAAHSETRQTAPASAGQNQALRLITQEQIVAIVGAYQSSVTLAATAVPERYGIPWVIGDSVAANITQRGFHWIFRVTPIASDFGKNYMEFLNDLKS